MQPSDRIDVGTSNTKVVDVYDLDQIRKRKAAPLTA